MSLIISDETLHAAHMSEAELRQEIAILLYQKRKLSLGQASKFAEMERLPFQHLLASRDISLNYDVTEFEQDIETLKRLGMKL